VRLVNLSGGATLVSVSIADAEEEGEEAPATEIAPETTADAAPEAKP